MTPAPYLVADTQRETADTVTLDLVPAGEPLRPFRPGQFSMLYPFGAGEIAVSASGIDGNRLSHTIRAVGEVSEALCRAEPGRWIGVRGPYGTVWQLPPAGYDALIVTGGIGLAPLRPLIRQLLDGQSEFGRISVLLGFREPGEMLYLDELPHWPARITVDRPEPGWEGQVGLVTILLDDAEFNPERCAAYLCGPEPMMRATAGALLERGMPPEWIRVSLERNMRCGTGWCGHCQLGPLMICRDGPVLGWDRVADQLAIRER